MTEALVKDNLITKMSVVKLLKPVLPDNIYFIHWDIDKIFKNKDCIYQINTTQSYISMYNIYLYVPIVAQ